VTDDDSHLLLHATHLPVCTVCYATRVAPPRRGNVCAACAPRVAPRRCVVPMHKSNYVLVTDAAALPGINNKR
jgi:NADPH-dependent ferric siderophore reductase